MKGVSIISAICGALLIKMKNSDAPAGKREAEEDWSQ
jgi:hypothetical protein